MILGSAMMLQPLKDTSSESPHLRDQGLWADRVATLLSHSALDQMEVTLSLWADCASCTPGVFVMWIALSLGVDTHPVLSESIKGNAASY